MPINNIPGVGPTNADIATAVAAPSAATIAAAVAAPSAATIAAAVAAPSSATIASAVAAAVPTTAGITSIVQANAGSPFGGTWTSLYANSPATLATSLTVSGLGSYKYLRVRWFVVANSAGNNFEVRLNGDTGSNYNDHRGYSTDTSPFTAVSIRHPGTGFNFRRTSGLASEANVGGFEIWGSNQSGVKALANQEHTFFDSAYRGLGHAVSTWRSTAAITSITFFFSGSGAFDSSTVIYVDGAN